MLFVFPPSTLASPPLPAPDLAPHEESSPAHLNHSISRRTNALGLPTPAWVSEGTMLNTKKISSNTFLQPSSCSLKTTPQEYIPTVFQNSLARLPEIKSANRHCSSDQLLNFARARALLNTSPSRACRSDSGGSAYSPPPCASQRSLLPILTQVVPSD